MATKAKKAIRGKLPKAIAPSTVLAQHKHGSVTTAQALSHLFTSWLERNMKAMQERLTCAEPASMAASDLRCLLTGLANANDNLLHKAIHEAASQQVAQAYQGEEFDHRLASALIEISHDQAAISALRQLFSQWAKVQDSDIMLVFLGDQSRTNDDSEHFLNGLKLSPNRAFTWRLLVPGAFYWPHNLDSFKQQLWVTNFEFINDCIHDLGRPLPLMELGAVASHFQDPEIFEQTIKHVLTPAELAYALAFGAFQLDLNPAGLPPGSPPQKPQLKLNLLFTQSR